MASAFHWKIQKKKGEKRRYALATAFNAHFCWAALVHSMSWCAPQVFNIQRCILCCQSLCAKFLHLDVLSMLSSLLLLLVARLALRLLHFRVLRVAEGSFRRQTEHVLEVLLCLAPFSGDITLHSYTSSTSHCADLLYRH